MVDFVNIILNVIIVSIISVILFVYFYLTNRYNSSNLAYCVKEYFIESVTEAAEAVLGPIKDLVSKISSINPF